MKQKKPKLKIITKEKVYSLQDSVFYKLSSKQKLANLLYSTPQELKSLIGVNNYHVFIQAKNGKPRSIQNPLLKLDKVHTRIASLLCRIETSDVLHSGKKGRSNITNALVHRGLNKRVITADIKSFFPNTTRSSVFYFFYDTMKCKADIADMLAKVLTYNDHVPTGSRVSMSLAYFANKKMFDEMETAGKQCGAAMTIYVDDLTFSGANLQNSFIWQIEVIAKKYGHRLHPSKTRFYDADAVKLITGTALKDNVITPRNRHLKDVSADMTLWHAHKNRDPSLANRIVGRFTYLGSIDSRFKDKARSFRQTVISQA